MTESQVKIRQKIGRRAQESERCTPDRYRGNYRFSFSTLHFHPVSPAPLREAPLLTATRFPVLTDLQIAPGSSNNHDHFLKRWC